ncbi:hypothetical protein [Pollutimonas bauzanensis]|uniref:hypothetical protein n=1 Tax=Pollutimonas bauzanensis TaxID=658167 RepID=UPI001160AC16|nr:hypothetical protein [Pollutimonas bauzanensis]
MKNLRDFSTLVRWFQEAYDAESMDQRWMKLSQDVQQFWVNKILVSDSAPIPDADCDNVIRILDRNGKGNSKDTEAVARAMIPQGAWQRLLNEFHSNQALGQLVYSLLIEKDVRQKAALIDELYVFNSDQKNYLTGKSGNAINAFLSAYDPNGNLSIISLNDRRTIIDFLGLSLPFDWDSASIGTKITVSNRLIMDAARHFGLAGSARTVSRFFYFEPVKALWKGEHTVKTATGEVSVTVPTESDEEEATEDPDSIRESMQIQAILARIGTEMGFTIWLPKSDRSRVLKVWQAQPGELLDELPLGYDPTTIATIEQIDVLWLRRRSIVRAFEVEHTTSIYSGLLRMADLVAMQPNLNIKLHIVAPVERREKVMKEIKRPVFSLLEGRALSEICTYLSFDSMREVNELKHLSRMSDEIIEDYEETAGDVA